MKCQEHHYTRRTDYKRVHVVKSKCFKLIIIDAEKFGCCDLKELLNLLELNYYFESKIAININLVQLKIHYYYSNIWGCEILDIPK